MSPGTKRLDFDYMNELFNEKENEHITELLKANESLKLVNKGLKVKQKMVIWSTAAIKFETFKSKVFNLEERNRILENLDNEYTTSFAEEIPQLKNDRQNLEKVYIQRFIFNFTF